MSFIKTPNLPEGDTVLAAVSCTYQSIISALKSRGVSVIEVASCCKLSGAVSSHADMLLHHLGNNKVVVAKGESALKKNLEQAGFDLFDSNICIKDGYVHEIPLNAARIGHYLFCNLSYLDPMVKQYCEENNIATVAVRQGYAKCSTVVVNDLSIITADPSIGQAAKLVGLDVLQISPGGIELKGYTYGFIGGCCGLIGKNKLAFAGNIRTHPDYSQIYKFCYEKEVELISLADMPLTDIGGIIPLKTGTK